MASADQINRLGDCSQSQMGGIECMAGAKSGSYSNYFNDGADPVIEGGKMLIGNGVYQGKLRTITPIGKRGKQSR